MIERIEVLRGSNRDRDYLFGPFPGIRLQDTVAYEFELPDRFETFPGRTRLERTFVLLDVGVSFSNPPWARVLNPGGSIADRSREGEDAWYVDLVTIEHDGSRFTIRDLYLDVLVPLDGRHYRMLDLDEYADAMADGSLTLEDAVDGLKRWQLFLDRYLHRERWPESDWTDFPPRAIRPLQEFQSPLADPVPVEG